MSFTARARLINPRLGTYFSIFAAIFAALFFLALIFEQLNFDERMLSYALFLGPLLLYGAIGISVATREPLEYFAAGRRVPASYTGLLLATGAVGATFMVAGAGALFITGFDALVLMIGGLSGFVCMAMLLAPFYRKFGAYTVPSYLGRRFESTSLRLLAAMVVAVPMLLVLSAELTLGAQFAALLTGHDAGVMTLVLAFAVAAWCAPGGKRSFTWAGVAQSIAALLALIAVAATVATLVTSLPVPQLTHGPLVRNLVRNEINQGLPLVSAAAFAFELPGQGFQTIAKPYTSPFGMVGPVGFVLGCIMIASGIAAAPWLLPRVAATPGVYEARKSIGWATVLFGIIMLTVSSAAVFLRDGVLDVIMNERPGAVPQWLADAKAMGFAAFDDGLTAWSYAALSFDRDSVLFTLPLTAGLPKAFVFLGLAGALAAALMSASATSVSLAAILAEDVVRGMTWEPAANTNRIWISRCFVPVAALAGACLTILAPTDPLRLVLWALALTGASLFPLLILSIWWKRLTLGGAVTALLTGFITASLAIFAGEAGAIPLHSAIAGVLGLPLAAGAAIAVSSMWPETSRHNLEIVRDIRVPGGEIIYDREMRRLHIKSRAGRSRE
ncbi:MAG: solute symporter family protein [Hyphomicrobium sp.]